MSESGGDRELSCIYETWKVKVVPVFGDSLEEAVELGEVLTLSVPVTGGSAGPKNGAIRESFRFGLRTTTGGGSVKAFPGASEVLERVDVALVGISSLKGEEG
jgi:hypothetical protein